MLCTCATSNSTPEPLISAVPPGLSDLSVPMVKYPDVPEVVRLRLSVPFVVSTLEAKISVVNVESHASTRSL
jgi:hypothetical protein